MSVLLRGAVLLAVLGGAAGASAGLCWLGAQWTARRAARRVLRVLPRCRQGVAARRVDGGAWAMREVYRHHPDPLPPPGPTLSDHPARVATMVALVEAHLLAEAEGRR